jgi:hypothetical protein
MSAFFFFNLVGIYILIREEGSVFSLLPLVSPSRTGSLVSALP